MNKAKRTKNKSGYDTIEKNEAAAAAAVADRSDQHKLYIQSGDSMMMMMI